MAFHSEWLRNNPKGPPGPIPPKGAEGALGSPLGSHLMPLGPIVPVSRDDNVATRVIGGGAGIARAYKQGRRAARSVYGFERHSSSVNLRGESGAHEAPYVALLIWSIQPALGESLWGVDP